MADGEQPKIRLDKFTAKVVPDPKNPGRSLVLQGFLGAAPEPAQTRLYWDASLSSFVDIDNADILHSEPLPKEQSPLGGSYLWVSTSAEVTASSAGGTSAKGKFFEGPVTSAYGSAFGGGTAQLRKQGSPTIGQWCTFTYCPVVAAPAAEPAAGAGAIGSYAPHCWYSWNACPTLYGCGPHHTLGCPMVERPGAGGGGVAGSYAPGCWYSFNACPTMFGCGPHRTPACPMVEPAHALTAACPPHAAAGAAPAVAGSYAPHCWFSWNACPTLYGCGPHHTPACPMVERPGGGGGGIAGSYAPGCWYSFNACPTMFGCGPHHTPGMSDLAGVHSDSHAGKSRPLFA